MTAATRINARLPPEVARKLEVLERRMGLTTTEVVLESIERFYEAVTDEAASPAAILERVGFLGCGEGPEDLSASYKAHVTASLGRKA